MDVKGKNYEDAVSISKNKGVINALKRKNFNNPYIQIATVMLVVLVLAVVPLIVIGFYAHPCADDFSYGYYTHAFWSTTHSLSQTLHWAFYQVKSTYDTWQGTFSSVFLMSLSPAIWGEGCYFLTPVIMLLMIVFPHFYLLKKMIIDRMSGSKSIWIIISSTVCFLLIETMMVPVEGIFWFNGAVHYVFMHGCMITLFGTLLGLMDACRFSGKIFLCLFASVLAVLCGGANYPTALLGILSTFVLVVFAVWRKKRLCAIVPLVVYGTAFYMNITAYGNLIRQASFEKEGSVTAILTSFSEMLSRIGDWMSLQIFLFMLLLVPFFWKTANTDKFNFKWPLLVTVLSFCSNACMLTPGLYAMGISGAGRTLNIVKMWFIAMLFLNEGYCVGYIKKKIAAKLPEKRPDIRLWVAGVWVLLLALFVINTESRMYDYSSYAAYVSLQSGEARLFHQEYMERLELLTGEDEVVELFPYSVKPYLLYFDDVTSDIYDWRNNAVARWYGKKQVFIRQ